MAASRGKTGLTAISVIYAGRPQEDEERYMRAVVEQFGLPFAPMTAAPTCRLPIHPRTLSASRRRSLTLPA